MCWVWGFFPPPPSSVVTRVKSLLQFYGFEPLSWTLFPGLDHLLGSRSLCSNYSAINSSALYSVLCSGKKTHPLPHSTLPLGPFCGEGLSAAGSSFPTRWQPPVRGAAGRAPVALPEIGQRRAGVICRVRRQIRAAGFGPRGQPTPAAWRAKQGSPPHSALLHSSPHHKILGRRTKHPVRDDSIFQDEETEVLLD